jgi:LPS-assembly protein
MRALTMTGHRRPKKPKVGNFAPGMRSLRLACPAPGPFAPLSVIRRLAQTLALACLAAAPCAAADPELNISSDTTSYNEANGETVLAGKAVLVDTGLLITADEIRFNQKRQSAVASGHVTVTQLGDRILADRISYNRVDGSFSAEHIRIGKFPFYIEGPSAEGHLDRTGKGGEIRIHGATLTYGEPGPYQPNIKAKELLFSPGHYLRITQADLGVGGYRPLPFTNLAEDLARKTGLGAMTLEGGYRHNLGPYIDAGLHLPVVTGLSAGPDLGLYAYRGLMAGPIANYAFGSGDETTQGNLRSGYIYDYGNRGYDLLNNPVPKGRAFVEWRHDQTVTPDLAITGNIVWSSDSEVIRDFHSKEFVPVQEPDNFLEAVYGSGNVMATAITRFQPDAFYAVQERLPDLRFNLLPTSLPGGFVGRFDAGIAHLEELPPDGGGRLREDRLDLFASLSRPFTYKGIVDFDPVIGARYTQYWNTVGAATPGGVSRILAEIGADADVKMSGTWDYKNPYLGIDGLRHVIVPNVSYRFIPDATRYEGRIPAIDRDTFTSYLPVLELGDMTAIDRMASENILRLGLNNILQTRDKTYGSRDLVTFNVADDVRFQRDPGQSDFSNLYSQLTITPARWFDLHFEDSVSATRFEQRARDATITFRGAEVWSAGFGVGYLSDSFAHYMIPGLGSFPIQGLNTYHAEMRYRLTEQYEAFARGDYDYRAHRPVDQFYGISQRFANTWIIEYALVISNGPDKTQGGHLSFNVSLNLIRF